jgi:hypothetical protein
MTVKELLETIERAKKRYSNFENWSIALEHVSNPEKDINYKKDIIKMDQDGDVWVFIKSHSMGCCSYFVKKKIFGIQIHY